MNPNPDPDGNLRLARALSGELPSGFEPLPRALQRLATVALGHHDAGSIKACARGRLQNWAKKKRKAKLAAASRRRNRGAK